ncbi:uncharacterized protein [Apostichopus japonicus]|uniref:uncharacterized protein isoform X1 n=1 Tax=Stichopus japonicus TaxID=307972 RepID=UPI003AB60903
MDLLRPLIFVIFLAFAKGSPTGVRSLTLNLISCPKDSVLLDQFRAASPCSVFCLQDEDCGASGLACCSTDCGTRCVAESILKRTQDDNNDIDTEIKEDDELYLNNQVPVEGSLIDKQLSVLKDKLNERREQTDGYMIADDEDDSDEETEDNDLVEVGEAVIDEGEEMIGGVQEASDEDEEVISSTPSPSTEEIGTTMAAEDEVEDDEEEEEDGDGEDDEDEDDWGEFDDYSYDEEETEDELELLLMKLLLTLKSKQNTKHSPWNDVVHSSRSLLEQSADHKNDFAINAMPPPGALEETAIDEETRALDDRMDGFFMDKPFTHEEMKRQGAAGRRSSMERREKSEREVDQGDSPNLANELINHSNAMR